MPAPGSFAPWLDDLAPGLADPSRAARDRILYRSAEERPRSPRAFPGDSMSVDMDDGLRLPIEALPRSPRDDLEVEP